MSRKKAAVKREVLKDPQNAIIMIADSIAGYVKQEIDVLAHRSLPVVVVLPNFTGESELGMMKIKKAIERATGSSQIAIS